jgi:hypothetical protein
MIEKFQQLASELQSAYPNRFVLVTELRSGKILLEIGLSDGGIEMEYWPGQGYGVSLLINGEFNPFGIGHDHLFDTFEEAKSFTLELLQANI